MFHRHVESAGAIRARFRLKLAKSRRNDPRQHFDYPPEPPPGTAPLTPARPAQVVEGRGADPQLATGSLDASQNTVSALEILRADLNNVSHATRQHVNALGGRLDSMRVSSEGHQTVQQQQLDTINNSINALDLSPLQAIYPMEGIVTASHQAALDIVEMANTMQHDLSHLTARSNTFMANGLAAVGSINTGVRNLHNNVYDLRTQSESTYGRLLESLDALSTQVAANTRSMHEVDRHTSDLKIRVSDLQTSIQEQGTAIDQLTHADLLSQPEHVASQITALHRIVVDLQTSILGRVDTQSSVINKSHDEVTQQRTLLSAVQADVRFMLNNNTSLHELQILQQILEQLGALKTLSGPAANLTDLSPNAAPSHGVRHDLQAELERVGEGSSTGTQSPVFEDDSTQHEHSAQNLITTQRQGSPQKDDSVQKESSTRDEGSIQKADNTKKSQVEEEDIDWISASNMLKAKQQGKLISYESAFF